MAKGASGWVIEIPQQRSTGAGGVAHELSHTLQQHGGASGASRGTGAGPAASGGREPRPKMIGQSAEFVHFFTGKDDAKASALGGHHATAHRRIHPVQFQSRLGQTGSILIGLAISRAGIGHRYPNLTLKCGMTVIDVKDAVITYGDRNRIAVRPGLIVVKSYSAGSHSGSD